MEAQGRSTSSPGQRPALNDGGELLESWIGMGWKRAASQGGGPIWGGRYEDELTGIRKRDP
jgi:hypothetical protein